MGLWEGAKNFYYSLEERYYGFLDGVNTRFPVYDIIDPIDKVIPSFMAFALAFFMIALGILAAVSGLLIPATGNALTVSVLDLDEKPISGASVTFMAGGFVLSMDTTDELGTAIQPDVNSESTVDILVEKDGYLSETKSVKIDELPKAAQVKLQRANEAFTTRTVRLVDSLGQPVQGSFSLKFKCSEPYAPSIDEMSLGPSDRGTAQVRVPGNCGRLTVDVSDSTSFSDVVGYNVVAADSSIQLREERAIDSAITINVKDAQGRPIDGINVQLYQYSELLENPNVGPIDTKISAGGKATFNKPPASYVAKSYDPLGLYGEATSERIVAESGKSAATDLILSEQVKGKITLKVTDKASGAAIANARVKLLIAAGDSELTTLSANSAGEAQFNISRDVEYKAIVVADGYQLARLNGLRISETPSQAQLLKCTPTTCGSLKVKVIDQDSNPINNAVVTLYNASTNFISGYNSRASDINGIAKFSGVSAGNYYAFAFREGFSGRSDAKAFDSSAAEISEALLTINMEIGMGAIKAIVNDKEGRAVPFSRIELYDARTNQLVGSDITDANGTKEFPELKANRKIYLVAKKQDEQVFASYTTAKRPLIVSSTQVFDVTMEKPILKDNIELQFAGLFDSSGGQAQNVKAGAKYIAKFKLRIPEEKDYDVAGVHLRVGDDVLMEKDSLVIKEVNAPKTSQARATRLEAQSSGLDEDDYGLTTGDAKWVNLEWRRPPAGVYEIEAEIGVRDSATIASKLPLYYRAWGDKAGEPRDRFPLDNTVVKELYGNVKQEVLQVGVVTLCDESFCFAATITDKENDLIESVSDNYNARIFNPYKLQFMITNNSAARIHNNANLRVKNFDESLKFFAYKLLDAQSAPREGTLNGFEFPRFDVGNLQPKNSIRLESDFTPQRSMTGVLNIQLVSDQAIVFEKNISIAISSPKELDVKVDPLVYPSGVQNDIYVLVKDKSTGVPVEGAIARLKDRAKNVLDFAITGKDGNVALIIPGQKPGEKISLEVEKTDYNVKVIELEVSDRLLEINPSQIGTALNIKTRTQSEEKLSVRNITTYPLTIKDIRLTGSFKNLIDTTKVRNWLESSYLGMALSPDEKQEIILKTFLSEGAKQLKKRETVNGELVIVAGNFGGEWIFRVPVKVAIGLGDEVDNPACLSITKSEWTVSTTGVPKRTEFQLQNNCTVAGKPVGLQDLAAKVTWKSNPIGEYMLNIGPDETVLRSGYTRLLLGAIKPEQTITAILSFTPYGGMNGTAEADIIIEASNPLDTDEQVLQNIIKTKVTSISLGQCITYDKERLTLNQGENGTVTVTATESCGEPIDFEIESELVTSPKREFRLTAGQSQAIEVFSEKNYPGQYALYISPKFSSAKKEQLVKNLRVIINATGCWQLGKYEFDVYDDPANEFDGYDLTTLSNACVEKPVTTKVFTKDIGGAAQDGLFWGLLTMGAVMLTNASDPKVDWLGRNEAEKEKNRALQQAKADKAARVGDMQAELAALRSENSKLKADTAATQAAISNRNLPNYKTQLAQMQSKLDEKDREIQGLQKANEGLVAAMKTQSELSQAEIEKNKETVEDIRQQEETLSRELNSIRNQLEAINNELNLQAISLGAEPPKLIDGHYLIGDDGDWKKYNAANNSLDDVTDPTQLALLNGSGLVDLQVSRGEVTGGMSKGDIEKTRQVSEWIAPTVTAPTTQQSAQPVEPGPDTSALRDGSYGILFGEWKYYASYKNPKPEPASEEEIAQLEALPKSAQGNIYISGGKPVTFLEFSRINNIPYSSEPSAMTAAPPSKTGNPPAGTYQYDEDKRTWVIKVPGAMDQPVPSGSDLEGKLDNIRNEWGWREFTVSPDDGPIEPIVPKTDIPYAIEDGHYKFENGAWNRVMSNGALAPIENSGDLGKERYTILDKINARRAAEGNNPGEFIVTNGIDSDAPAKAGAQIPATDALPTGMNAGVYEFDSGSGAWMNLGRPVTNPAGAAYLETKREERKANGLVGERFYLIDDGTTRDAPAAPQSAVPKRDTNIIPPATQAILPSAIPPVQGLLGITGYAGASGSPATGILGTVFGGDKGLIGKLAGGGGGIVRAIFGTNPFVAGLAGGLIGGTVSYMTQKDEMQFSSMQPDTEIKDIKLVEGAANKEKEYANVNLTVEGFGKKSERAPTVPQPLVNNPDLISQGIESFRLIFENRDSFTTSEDRPEYAHLKVTGVRHKYKDKVYDRKDFIDDKGGFIGFFDKPTVNSSKSRLEEDPAQTMEQRFRLEFNSIPPSAEKVEDIGLLNCQDGTRVGKTGADALPKVKFRWNWNDIKGDTCNEDNLNGVYCDATQFSIALLKRVNALNEYLGQNGPDFTCPSSLTNQPARNEIGTFDTGIEALATVRNGNDIDVVATIRNTNPGEVPVKATIKLIKPGNSGEIACSKGMQSVSVAAGGKEDASCTFSSLPAGVYTARAEITPTISCTNCGDIAVTNSLSKQFSSGVSGLEQCEPFSTARLSEFLEASGEKNPGLVATAKFNALLMVDGYSSDFQHDFDLAQSEAFFNAPDFYTDSRAGLGNYFKDTSLFSFDAYSQPNFTLPGPGTYNIVIDITYKDRTWKLFDTRGNPTATITIRMEKLKAAEPDSPFYYVPFDGLLGEKDGRIGYGINFAGDPVQVDNSRAPRRTVDITGSATIPDGILTVSKGKNFKSMQVDERGVVAKLSRANGSPTLLFQPSNATPVILKIDKNTEEDAYAIYEPAIDGDAVDVGQQLTLWNGIGAACRGFNDEVMSQQQFVPDTHGISTRCALVGPNQRSKYALEFCGKVVNYGSAYYETVFYTPQDSDSYLKLVDVSSDSAQFISEGAAGNQVPLNGNGLTPKINSLEDIFSLVTAQSMCITGTSLNAEFFWNPKQIFTTIQDSEEDAISSCIAPVKRNK